jgi:hypothetical protein
MALPTSPTNGQIYVNNGVVYQYNSTSNAWLKTNKIATLSSITQTEIDAITPSEGLIVNDGTYYKIYKSGAWRNMIPNFVPEYNHTIVLDAMTSSSPSTKGGNIVSPTVVTSNSSNVSGYISSNYTFTAPIYNATAPQLNSKQGFTFNGATNGSGLRVYGLPITTTGFTVVMLTYVPSTITTYTSPWRLVYADGSNESDIGVTYPLITQETYSGLGSSNAINNTPLFNQIYVSSISVTPTTTTVYRNKVKIGNYSITRTNLQNYNNMFIGFGRWNNQFFNGSIGKVIIAYQPLTQTQINAWVDDFAIKYNVNLG